jgi:hypothetical protein
MTMMKMPAVLVLGLAAQEQRRAVAEGKISPGEGARAFAKTAMIALLSPGHLPFHPMQRQPEPSALRRPSPRGGSADGGPMRH